MNNSNKKPAPDDNDLEKPIDEEFAEQLYAEPDEPTAQCNEKRDVSITGADLHPCDEQECREDDGTDS